MVSGEPMTELVGARLCARSASCAAVTFGSLLRIHGGGRGAIRHCLIRMRNYRHDRHSSGECEGQSKNQGYRFHDRPPFPLRSCLPEPARAISDAHHALRGFGGPAYPVLVARLLTRLAAASGSCERSAKRGTSRPTSGSAESSRASFARSSGSFATFAAIRRAACPLIGVLLDQANEPKGYANDEQEKPAPPQYEQRRH